MQTATIAGTPDRMVNFAAWQQHRFGEIATRPAPLATRASGLGWRARGPDPVAQNFALSPPLVALGEIDTTVPPAWTHVPSESAREPKELLALPNFRHGEYHCEGLGVYAGHLTIFFDRTLLTGHQVGVAP